MTARFDAARTIAELSVDGRRYRYCSLPAIEAMTGAPVSRLPFCLKILLENVVRQCVRGQGSTDAVGALLEFPADTGGEIAFRPARVMMDDTAGTPLLGDLAAMRDAVAEAGGDPASVAPAIPVDFVVDHSVIAEHAGAPDALARNAALEFDRNTERFALMRWAAQAFAELRVVPPGGGICHQINLEYLAQVVRIEETPEGPWLIPDSMAGIDSHTPMVNSLGIVGWGVSGIEGVAAALGGALSLRVPRVVGIRLEGRLRPGITATDLVLTLAQAIRGRDLVGAFVEYYGSGLAHLSLPERATVANMTPECGTTMSYFPIDAETLRYLTLTGRDAAHVARVEAYARAQGLWRDETTPAPRFSDTFALDLATVEPSLAAPGQPHHRIGLADTPHAFARARRAASVPSPAGAPVRDGDVVIAAITSCTNTSNPAGMLGAGMLARNAVARGLKVPPWVKTSLSPGSRVVADYLANTGLQTSLDALGFQVTGFGCMTCVGFSGPLAPPVASAIAAGNIATAAVTSGNRNYDGRVHAQVRAAYLASPPLVVAYALAGTVLKDLSREPLGEDAQGVPVYLQELWPDADELARISAAAINAPLFAQSYATLYTGSQRWRDLPHARGPRFTWPAGSTVIRRPPEFDAGRITEPGDLRGARILALFGDDVTTEHVSPMGPLPAGTQAADYLQSLGVSVDSLGTYAGRRLVADVMLRGTFASPHLPNAMTPGQPGGSTLHQPDGARMTIYDAAQRYRAEGVPLVVVAGARYGTGSSRDWSAKGPHGLGVKAVLAVSFERLHRANLVAAGVLPLRFAQASDRALLTGAETLDIAGIDTLDAPGAVLACTVRAADGTISHLKLIAGLETQQEVAHFRAGGTYRYLLRDRMHPRAAVAS
ncbi:MAG: aconitate hydratase AcnA [Burkholderiales bacterium]